MGRKSFAVVGQNRTESAALRRQKDFVFTGNFNGQCAEHGATQTGLNAGRKPKVSHFRILTSEARQANRESLSASVQSVQQSAFDCGAFIHSPRPWNVR